jgi:hypothetical protein
MLKSSSLCLFSSNLGTLWFKIKQFWPFEEMSSFSNGGHLGWRAWLSDITFKGNPRRMIQAKFGLNWSSGFRGEDLKKNLDGRWMPSDGNSSHRQAKNCYQNGHLDF